MLYHDAEITFADVAFIRCPTSLREARFREAGRTPDGTRFEIRTPESTFEIVAESASVTLGKVYHYDRGSQLQPGERIAPGVTRTIHSGDAEKTTTANHADERG